MNFISNPLFPSVLYPCSLAALSWTSKWLCGLPFRKSVAGRRKAALAYLPPAQDDSAQEHLCEVHCHVSLQSGEVK